MAGKESGNVTKDDLKVPLKDTQADPPAGPVARDQDQTPDPDRDRTGDWRDLVTPLLEHGPAVLGLVGLLVYAVVRVAHDSFYGHFGLAPEDVGLTQATILGRAALYLAFFLAVSGAVAGLWTCLALPLYRRVTDRDADTGGPVRNAVALALAGLVLLVASVAFLAPNLTEVLWESTTEEACDRNRFCTAASLVPGLSLFWVLAVPLVLLAAALAFSLAFLRGRNPPRRLEPAFGFVGLVAVTIGVVAPELLELLDDLEQYHPETTNLLATIDEDLSPLEGSPWAIKAGVFAFVYFGLAACCTALVNAQVMRPRARSGRGSVPLAWATLSFLLVLPALVGFVAPEFTDFLTESYPRFVPGLAAWLALLAIALLALQRTSGSGDDATRIPVLCTALAVIAACSLYLAWERGKAMAEFAESGNRLVSRHFRLLSVRTDVVCLDPVKRGEDPPFQRGPYLYLGQSAGTLVLFDYVRLQQARALEDKVGRRLGGPKTLPIRVPASGAFVRIARIPQSRWTCPDS